MAHVKIKNIVRFIAKTLGVFLLLIAFLYGVLHLSSVQLYLSEFAANRLSSKLGTTVTVKGVDVSFWDKIILEDVYIADQRGDTLLYTKKLGATIGSLHYSKRTLNINTIFIQKARIGLAQRDSVFNFQFIINAFSKPKDTIKEHTNLEWGVHIQSVEVDDSRLTVQLPSKVSDTIQVSKNLVHFDAIDLRNLSVSIKDIHIDSLLTMLNVGNVSFVERSGFAVKKAEMQMYINANTIALSDLRIETNHSSFSAFYCNIMYRSFDDFNDFVRKVKFDIKLEAISLLADDVGYFVSELRGNKNRILMRGELIGTVSDFKAKDFDLRFGKQTHLNGSIAVSGLPCLSETFFFCDIKDCETRYTDLNKIQLPPFASGTTLDVPRQIKTLGKVNFRGNITGFVNDFVAYGTIFTDAGIVYPDTKITLDTLNHALNLSGQLRTSKFALGRVFETDKVGDVTMNIKLLGRLCKNEMLNFKIDGEIASVECMRYVYSNVAVNGTFSNRMFDGFVHIDDPNIFLDFDGSCDFSKKVPELDFTARIEHAWLNKLHLLPNDSLTMFAASMQAKLTGSTIDNVEGIISVNDFLFQNAQGKVSEPQITLSLAHNFQGREIELQSNTVDMSVNGDFNFKSIANDAFLFLKTHIPSLTWKRATGNEFVSKNIEFSIDLKNIQPAISLFNKEIKVPQLISIVGNFNPSLNQLHFHAHAPEVAIGSNQIKNIDILGETESNVFQISTSVDMQVFEKSFKKIRNNLSFKNDSVLFESRWFLKDSNTYQGSLFAQGALSRAEGANNPSLNLAFRETDITLSDSIWHVSPFSILIDSASVALRKMTISKDCDIFSLYGRFSDNPSDSLVLYVENFDFKNINRLIPDKSIRIDGRLMGTVSVHDVMGAAIVRANIQAADMFFNEKKIGTLSVKTEWDGENQNLAVTSFVQRGRIRILNLNGSYFPNTRQLALDGELNDFDANTVVSLLPSDVRDLHGLISGSLKVRGPIFAPEVYGTFDFQKISFLIDYLKVRYNFTGSCVVTKNKLSYKNVTVNDSDGNAALSDGEVDFNTFPLVGLNIIFHPRKVMMLNTRYSDNSLFYGKVYGTGTVTIKGNPNMVRIGIAARTEENSTFNIPISDETTVEEKHFLTFVNKKSKDSLLLRKQRQQINLSGVELDFNLEITPDVVSKIIFDEKTGDLLESTGSGSVQLKIDTKGLFTIYGDYTIAQGKYLLTLGNLVSKRFSIAPGSRISWDGAPLNAMIDITAQYSTKASLLPLLMVSGDTVQSKSTTRVPVTCMLNLKNRILHPQIGFDIQLPSSASQQARDVLQNMTEDERNKQFVSLLVLNTFFNSNQKASANSGAMATSEILSGQLNKWLSGINDKVNIGVNYRPGDAQVNNGVEVGMSTQLINNRVTVNVNGYTDVGQKTGVVTTARQNNQMLGDVNVDVKINRSGTFRVRGFSRPRPERFDGGIDNSQGFGVFYTREFDHFSEFFRWKASKNNDTTRSK